MTAVEASVSMPHKKITADCPDKITSSGGLVILVGTKKQKERHGFITVTVFKISKSVQTLCTEVLMILKL